MPSIKTPNGTYNCAFEITIDLIGRKWKSMIIWNLLEHEVMRTGELKRRIPKITQKMLTQQLRELEADGLIERKVYEQVPPKVEYRLTEIGKNLRQIMEMMYLWGEDYARLNNFETSCPMEENAASC